MQYLVFQHFFFQCDLRSMVVVCLWYEIVLLVSLSGTKSHFLHIFLIQNRMSWICFWFDVVVVYQVVRNSDFQQLVNFSRCEAVPCFSAVVLPVWSTKHGVCWSLVRNRTSCIFYRVRNRIFCILFWFWIVVVYLVLRIPALSLQQLVNFSHNIVMHYFCFQLFCFQCEPLSMVVLSSLLLDRTAWIFYWWYEIVAVVFCSGLK